MLLNLTCSAFKITDFRSSVKESSLSRSIRSTIHAVIHPLILVLSHCVQMFPELLVSVRLMSCWGLWQNATSFCLFTSCFVVCAALFPFSQRGSLCMESMWGCLHCLCVCALNPDHGVCLWALLPQHPPTPAVVFSPFPPYLFLCVCYCSILFTTSPLLIFHSGRNTGQGWEGCPVPTLGLSHSQRNTPGRPNTLSTHAQCLVSLFNLHMSPSSSLIHRHTVELFKSLGWGAVKHHCHCAGGLLVSGSYSCCSPL